MYVIAKNKITESKVKTICLNSELFKSKDKPSERVNRVNHEIKLRTKKITNSVKLVPSGPKRVIFLSLIR